MLWVAPQVGGLVLVLAVVAGRGGLAGVALWRLPLFALYVLAVAYVVTATVVLCFAFPVIAMLGGVCGLIAVLARSHLSYFRALLRLS